jgi:hypothetical protein
LDQIHVDDDFNKDDLNNDDPNDGQAKCGGHVRYDYLDGL